MPSTSRSRLTASHRRVAAAASAAFIGALSCAGASATDIQVPADRPTIQQGIDAALDGDRVMVAEGTYNESIDFRGKTIQVLATGSAARTVISAGGRPHAVVFQAHEGEATVFAGFRVEDGAASGRFADARGGGILVAGRAAPEIRDNLVDLNRACRGGAGIAVIDAARPRIHDNRIEHNDALHCSGGGAGGGVLVASKARVVVEHNRISHNNAFYGAGIAINGGNHQKSDALIVRNTIFRNHASTDGGGIYSLADHVRIANNLVYENVGYSGAGIQVASRSEASHPVIANNTIVNSQGRGNELGLENYPNGKITVINNIIVHAAGYPVICPSRGGESITLYNNLVHTGRHDGIYGSCTVVGPLLRGDPQFVGGEGAAHAYWLQPTSPAIDAGENGAVPDHDRFDLTGAPRISGAAVDLGAIEFRQD